MIFPLNEKEKEVRNINISSGMEYLTNSLGDLELYKDELVNNKISIFKSIDAKTARELIKKDNEFRTRIEFGYHKLADERPLIPWKRFIARLNAEKLDSEEKKETDPTVLGSYLMVSSHLLEGEGGSTTLKDNSLPQHQSVETLLKQAETDIEANLDQHKETEAEPSVTATVRHK